MKDEKVLIRAAHERRAEELKLLKMEPKERRQFLTNKLALDYRAWKRAVAEGLQPKPKRMWLRSLERRLDMLEGDGVTLNQLETATRKGVKK